jgi:hypothetical protein
MVLVPVTDLGTGVEETKSTVFERERRLAGGGLALKSEGI